MTPPWALKLEKPSESATNYRKVLKRRLRMQVFCAVVSISVFSGLATAHWTTGLLERHFGAWGAGTIGTLLVSALVGVVALVLILVRRLFGSFWTSMTSIPLGALVAAFALTLFVGLIS